jgi:hypothetical protein
LMLSDAGSDAETGILSGDGTATGTIGERCAPDDAYGCAGHAQKGRLICSKGRWQPNGICSGSENCESTPGPTAGSCQPVATGCEDQPGDALICQGTDLLKCGIDLATTSKIQTCQYVCADGGCSGTCMPGTRQCSDLTPQTCDDAGTWIDGTACANRCSGGACSGTCSPAATQCNGQVVQTCDSTGTWQDGSACKYQACIGGSCTGVCAPNTKQCSNNGVETCSMSGQWSSPAACMSSACVGGACTGT